MKFLKKILNKKGVTLVELIVVIAITAILSLAVAGLFGPSMQLVNSLKSNANMDVVGDTANRYIRNSTFAADNVTVVSFDPVASLSDLDSKQAELAANAKDGYSVRALACINGRLYDFGKLTSNVSSYIGTPGPYRMFNEAFYAKNQYRLKVETDGKWISLSSQCTEADGTPLTQERTTSYNLVSKGGGVAASIDEAHSSLLILYTAYELPTP